VGAAAERRDLVVDQVMAEYRAYCAGELSALCKITEAPGGRVEYCGVDEDPAHWAICYVRASNRAVVPLAVGQEQRVAAEFDALDRRCAAGVWDPLMVPTPVALIGGREYPFKAARGRHLLGVVQLERQAVLLAAADDRLVAVLVVDGATRMLPLGRPRRVREVDVDLLRSFASPRASRSPDDPLRPSAGTRAHHIRIVPGRRVELGEGLMLSQLLEAMFADIEARATTPPRPPRREPAAPAPKAASADAAPRRPKRPKLKGKTWVPYVLRYFRKMALESSLDLVGLTGTIIGAIQARFPEFTITGEAFADALKLITATGTCLIAPHQKGERFWRINLEGLGDPTSAQHRRLCRETRGRVRVEEAAANQRSARPDAPAAGEGAPSSTVDADEALGDATDKRDTSPGESSDTPTGPATAAPDADRSAAQAEPAGRVSAGPEHETLELVRRLSMIPDTGHLFFIVCCLGMAVAELLTAAAGNDAASARANMGAALDATGPGARVDAAPHADEAVALDATGDGVPPVGEAPPADEAVALHATSDGPASVEEAPHANAAVALNATGEGPAVAVDVEVAPGASEGAAEDAPSLDEPLASAVIRDDAASEGAAEDAPPLDEPLASAVIRDDAASGDVDSGAWLRFSSRWTPATLRYVVPRASPRDAVLPRHQALAPVQPGHRCRDLGTLGPRGPPASRRG
jgi:hypothetical protein